MGNNNAKLRRLDELNNQSILDTHAFIDQYTETKNQRTKQKTKQTAELLQVEDKLTDQKRKYANLNEKLDKVYDDLKTELERVKKFKEKINTLISEQKDEDVEKNMITNVVANARQIHEQQITELQELHLAEVAHFKELSESNAHNQRELEELRNTLKRLEKGKIIRKFNIYSGGTLDKTIEGLTSSGSDIMNNTIDRPTSSVSDGQVNRSFDIPSCSTSSSTMDTPSEKTTSLYRRRLSSSFHVGDVLKKMKAENRGYSSEGEEEVVVEA